MNRKNEMTKIWMIMMGVVQHVKLKKAMHEVEDQYQKKIHALIVLVEENHQMIIKKDVFLNVEMEGNLELSHSFQKKNLLESNNVMMEI